MKTPQHHIDCAVRKMIEVAQEGRDITYTEIADALNDECESDYQAHDVRLNTLLEEATIQHRAESGADIALSAVVVLNNGERNQGGRVQKTVQATEDRCDRQHLGHARENTHLAIF